MLIEKTGFATRRFIISLLFLHAVTFLLHLAEIIIPVSSGTDSLSTSSLLFVFFNDALFVARFGVILFPLYVFIYFGSDFTARMTMALLLISIIGLQIALMQYFLLAKVPLGADFWSYSWQDIRLTIKASATIKWWQYLLFPVIIALSLRAHYTLQQYTFSLITSAAIGVAYVFLLGAFTWFPINKLENPQDKMLTLNKADYFLSKTREFYVNSNRSADVLVADKNTGEYPFMHKQSSKDELGDYLNKDTIPPNIVMLIIEGLGKTFTGPQAEYGGCMPFLDSLSEHGLYWSNFLSTTGRTFGVLPSMLGSLPYGATGFMEMGNNMPNHTSLVRLLKNNGYSTGFYYGGDAKFDNQELFLQKQGIDYVLDVTKFTPAYKKIEANEGGFSWGYPDKELYKRSFEVLKDKAPYLSIYLTVTTHEPFKFPGSDGYNNRFDYFLNSCKNKNEISANKGAFKTLMYADDAIRYFIETYKQRSDYQNTIFIITGDHRMIPVKHKNLVDRYHVPLLIYSPLLNGSKVFRSVSAHNDIPSTFISYLARQYGLSFPDSVHWLGKGLSFKTSFASDKNLAIMRNKGDLSEYLNGKYFLTDGDLYKLSDNMNMEPEDDVETRSRVGGMLESFKKMNAYVCAKNKLYRAGADRPGVKTALLHEEINAPVEKAADKPVIVSKQQAPADAGNIEEQLQQARIYAEDGNYKQARSMAEKAIKQDKGYKQSYITIIDIELMFNHKEEARAWYYKAIENFGMSEFKPQLERIKAQ
ncbi:MAG: sulfatase-like hydrolase/transferase [Bacteroidota bacterium]